MRAAIYRAIEGEQALIDAHTVGTKSAVDSQGYWRITSVVPREYRPVVRRCRNYISRWKALLVKIA